MSLRDLVVEPDCSGANSLMRLGNQVRRDAAFKDEGLGPGTSASFINRSQQFGSDLVNEFLGQIAAPPQTFRMDSLLQEMREIDAQSFHNRIVRAPPVIEEVNSGIDWANEFSTENVQHHVNDPRFIVEDKGLNDIWNQSAPVPFDMTQTFSDKPWTKEFFDVNESLQQMVSSFIDNRIFLLTKLFSRTSMTHFKLPQMYRWEYLMTPTNLNIPSS